MIWKFWFLIGHCRTRSLTDDRTIIFVQGAGAPGGNSAEFEHPRAAEWFPSGEEANCSGDPSMNLDMLPIPSFR